MENFKIFSPVESDFNKILNEAKDYYSNNNLEFENIFLKDLVFSEQNNQDKDPFNFIIDPDELKPESKNEEKDDDNKYTNNSLRFITSVKSPKNQKDFIKIYSGPAKQAAQQYGLSEDMILAQIALETGWGKSTPGYNIGGIKADKNWKGKSQILVTKEQGKNGLYITSQKFRVYNSPEEGFQGYINFLMKNNRYKPLIGVSDPYKAAEIMGKTGYATANNYTSNLKQMISQIRKIKKSI